MEKKIDLHSKTGNLPNIGNELEEKLNKVGICNCGELLEYGAEQSFLRVKTVYPDSCMNMLYALEGACQQIRWHGLSKERKQELKSFFNQIAK